MSKKIVSICITILMLITMLPMATFAAEINAPSLSVDSADATPGDSITVSIKLKNNPGIVAGQVNVAFDSGLTLTGATKGDAFPSYITFTMPKQLSTVGYINDNCNIVWGGTDINAGDIKDGTVLTLTFKVSEEAEVGDMYNITVTPSRVNDKDLATVELNAVQSRITIIDYTPGDVNDDGIISMLDTVLISRYIVDGCTYDPDGYAIRLNEKAADVNDDGIISMLDTVMISRYIVDGCKTDPNGYNIELKGSTKKCAHEMQAFEAKAATCTEDGNIAYWYCGLCEKYFADVNGSRVITFEDTVIRAEGHKAELIPAVPATETQTGLTEGSRCSVCGEILVPQEEIPMLQPNTANITYRLVNNDSYLAAQEIKLDPKKFPSTYVIGKELKLSNDILVPGYIFEGWYDGFGASATKITTISASETDDITLFAHWTLDPFNIQYESDLVPVSDDVYTVSQSKQLPTPQLDGYIFVGWSDGDGNIIRRIPAGTVGDKIYTANWMSERNKAWAKKTLDAPIIVENEETDTILFTYEIGRIENVPLYVIEDFGYLNQAGVSKTVSKEYAVKVNESLMEQYAKTVTNSTTNTAQWALSSGWTDSVSVNENFLRENDISENDAKTLCTTDSGNWLVSSGESGSTTTTIYNSSQDYNLHTATGNTKVYDTHDESGSRTQKVSADLTLGAKESLEVSGGADFKVGHVEGKAGVELNQELGLGVEGSGTNSSAGKTGTETDSGYSNQRGSIKHTGTDTANTVGWNSSTSYGGSNTVSNSESVSRTISEKIASEYGYGQNYINTGEETSSQGSSVSAADTNSYSAAVTYSTESSEKETITYSTSNTKTGYHRLVKAGTAHVFAIVGYDMKTASYFVSTYTVMDEESHNFEDYSYTAPAYDDNQISVIPFEIPFEVEEYVLSKVGETDGLEFNKNGMVTGYSGTERTVVIPEYHVLDNLDGTKSVIKVTGISPTAFKGNTNITGVELSDFITIIPANAFEGCSNLELINMPGVSSIGASAFKDCAFDTVFLSEKIENLGQNAFENLNTFVVFTNKKNVAIGATNSAANNIIIYAADTFDELNNSHLSVGGGTDIFVFCGRGNSFSNLSIESNANATVINRTSIESNSGIPIKSSSSEIQFEQVNVESAGVSVALTNERSSMYLYGESSFVSSNEHAVLCRSVDVIKTDYAVQKGVFSELEVDGNILYCGTHSGDNLVRFERGNYVKISEELYNTYLNGVYELTFDSCGGVMSEISKTVYYGEIVGALPIPTRTGFTFTGWYTEQSGGTQITEKTVSSFEQNATVYAHWTANKYKVTWNTGTGYSISVKRTSSPYAGAASGNLGNGAEIYYGDVLSITYTASTGYTIGSKGATSITVTGNVTSSNIYANASVNTYKVSWNTGTGYTIAVNRTSSPKGGASTGALSNGATIYYGDVLSVTYTASTGYTIGSKGATSITVTGNVTSSNIYATATVNSYKVSWNTGTGYTIAVNRTSSPKGGASTGALSNGATIYYGDVLSVTYTASTGYSISSKGSTSITVTGNVTSSNIYATAKVNSYTYNIVYKSSNGTDLGSSTATYNYGTTNTISAPAKSGYDTPGSQSVKWDSTSPKTITFTYTPTAQPTRQTIASGRWWTSSSGNTKLDYKVEAEWRNRTANSVEIRIIWTNTITNSYSQGKYGYKQEFEWWGWHQIASASEFSSEGGTRSASNSSGWHTYSCTPDDISQNTGSEWRDNNGKSGSWDGTIYFPKY